jgi:hypothetical protein
VTISISEQIRGEQSKAAVDMALLCFVSVCFAFCFAPLCLVVCFFDFDLHIALLRFD